MGTMVTTAELKQLIDERDRYLALLKEVTVLKDHTEQTEKMTIKSRYSLESVQRYVREQLTKWGVE